MGFPRVTKANFNVLDVGVGANGEYEWAVILGGGAPTIRADDGLCLPSEASGLFLYTRELIASQETIDKMFEAVTKQGVSTERLLKVVQEGCTYEGLRIKDGITDAGPGPASPTDFGAFCPDGRPKTDPFADCNQEQPPATGDNNSDNDTDCQDTLSSFSPVSCAQLAASTGCGNVFENPFARVVLNEECAKTCNACGN